MKKLYIQFRGINPDSLHLAFTKFITGTLAKNTDTKGFRVPKDPYGSWSWEGFFKNDNEKQSIIKLLRYTHGVGVGYKNNQEIEFNLFLRFCRILDVHPLQILTLPITYARYENNTIMEVRLSNLIGGLGR